MSVTNRQCNFAQVAKFLRTKQLETITILNVSSYYNVNIDFQHLNTSTYKKVNNIHFILTLRTLVSTHHSFDSSQPSGQTSHFQNMLLNS